MKRPALIDNESSKSQDPEPELETRYLIVQLMLSLSPSLQPLLDLLASQIEKLV